MPDRSAKSASSASQSPLPDDPVSAAEQTGQHAEWIAQLVEQADPAAIREVLENAGFRLDDHGELQQQRAPCGECGHYAHVSRALNTGRFLCATCWHRDLCET